MEFKSFMEALKGKQHKIDKNKNGQIDAQDFKILRKEENEQLEEATVKTQKYSWGTMKTVHHGSDFSIPLHPEHHQAIAKLKDEQEHNFKTEDGKSWTARRKGDEVHFQGANGGNSTTVKHSTMSEEVQIDEIHRMKTKLNTLDTVSNKSVARQKLTNLMKSGKARGALIANKMRTLNMGDDVDQEDLDALHEVLSKDAKAGDWIHDFVHSTNPKFEGKSKKERIKMALGAYYGKQNEETVEEGYYEKPASAYRRKGDEIGGGSPTNFSPNSRASIAQNSKAPVAPVPDRKYIKGTPEHKAYKATKKPINGMPTNEEVEQIEEKSDQAKQNKTMKNMMDASRGARYKLNNLVPDAEPEHKTARAHNVAIGRALRNEDKMTTTKDKSGKLVSFKYEGDWKKSTEKKEGSGKAANLAGQAMQKMAKANEEVEQIEEGDLSIRHLYNKFADAHANGNDTKPTEKAIRKVHGDEVFKHMKKAANANAKGDMDAEERHFDNARTAGNKTDRIGGTVGRGRSEFMRKRREWSEEVQIEEEKDEQEYGYEGDMAMTQLETAIRHATHLKDMMKPDTDLPEWVQSKITLATDYLQTAADYIHSEMNEAKSVEVKVNAAGDAPHEEKWEAVKKAKKPVAEAVQKADIPAYLRKAKGDTPLKMDDLKRKDTLSDAENLKRNRGVKESFDDEGNLIPTKISYKDFITEIKLADLPVRRIQGHSYGANYSDPEGADDYDEKKPMKPAAEKRGRGRPAGAKSGARKITGTSKLMNK